MTLERIFILWFLRFGALLSGIGIVMAFLRADTYVNLFIYSGAGSVLIGCLLMLFTDIRNARRRRSSN